MNVKPGDIVNYVLECVHAAGQIRPAIVTKVNVKPGCVDLVVFHVHDDNWLGDSASSVIMADYDSEGKERTWHHQGDIV